MPCFMKGTGLDKGSTLVERNLVTKDLKTKLQRLRCHEEANVYTTKEGESKKKDKMLTRNQGGEEKEREKKERCLQRHYIF